MPATWQECFALLGCAHEGTLKEIMVVRDPPSLLVFNVVEHGRRFIRCLEWTSDCSGEIIIARDSFQRTATGRGACRRGLVLPRACAGCVADLAGALGKPLSVSLAPQPHWQAGDALTPAVASASLLITRSITKDEALQTFVPARFLRGLLPEALLETYTFWQARPAPNGRRMTAE